jgi:hypothetical protein
MIRHSLLALALAVPALAAAQDEMPAVSTETLRSPPPARPAESPAASVPVPASRSATAGTTIMGDDDSPIGLYIMPWRNMAADGGLDRPARLLEEALLPLDPDVFRRQVEYHRALSRHLEKTGRQTP